jgi:hypothetical protein
MCIVSRGAAQQQCVPKGAKRQKCSPQYPLHTHYSVSCAQWDVSGLLSNEQILKRGSRLLNYSLWLHICILFQIG